MAGTVFISPTGEKKFLFQEDIPAAMEAGWQAAPEQTTMVEEEYWDPVQVGAGEVERRTRLGDDFQISPMDVQSEQAQWNVDEEEYGDGLGNDLAAFGMGAASGLTFGLSDALLESSGVDVGKYAEHNPLAHGVGVGGAILGASLLSGGAAGAASGATKAGRLGQILAKTPAGAVSRGAQKLGSKVGGFKGVLAAEMVEGAAYGTGQAISNLALTNEPLTAEAVSTELLQGGFMGAVAGGVGAGAFKLGEKAFKGIKSMRGRKAVSILDHTTDEGRVFTGDIARSIQQFDEAGAAALGAKMPKEVRDKLAKQLEQERKALLREIDQIEAVGLGYMQRAGLDLQRAEKGAADAAKKVGSTTAAGKKSAVGSTTAAGKKAAKAQPADTAPDIHAEYKAGLRDAMGRMAQASENFKVRQLRQLDKLGPEDLANLSRASREYADSINTLGRMVGDESIIVKKFADTVEDRLPGLVKLYRENQEAALGGPLGRELADSRKAMRKALGVKAEHAIGPKHVSDIFRKSPEEQLIAFEAIDQHFKVARKIAEETGDTTMLEGIDATLQSLKKSLDEADIAAMGDVKLSEVLAAAGLAEAAPDMEGPVDDLAKFFIAHKLVSGKTGSKASGFMRKVMGNAGARLAAQKGWQHGGALGAGVGSAVGYKVFAGVGDRLGVSGGLLGSTNKVAQQIAESVNKLAQGAAKAATKGATTATATLKATQFKESRDKEKEKEKSLRQLFKQRSDELHEIMGDRWQLQVMINDSLEPIRQANSGVGDQTEMQLMRTMEHLYETMPKDPGTLRRFGVSRWQPHESAIHAWARRVEAAQNPMKVVEDTLGSGAVTPQAAETLRELYPTIFQEVQLALVKKLPELQDSLTYSKRIKLSTLYGVPLDPAMEPRSIEFVQTQHAEYQQKQAEAQQQARPSGSTNKPEEPTGAQKLLAR